MTGRRRSLVRRLHQWLGVVGALGLVVLTATGWALLHPEWFGRGEPPVRVVAADPRQPDRLLRASAFLVEESRDGGDTWRDLPLALAPGEPVACRFDPVDSGTVWLLGATELLVSRDGGRVWEPLDLPPAVGHAAPARDLALPGPGRVLVATDGGAWVRGSTEGSWRVLWHAPPGGGDRLLDAVRRLHTGHWGPAAVARAHDVVAALTLLVVVSGLALAVRRRARRDDRR